MAEFRALWLAQQGNTPAEYQDAFAGNAAAGRFAVADGATESGFARSWARLLAEAFVADDAAPGAFAERLADLQARWHDELPPGPLPWFAQLKADKGAFAAFLGVVLRECQESAGCDWQAVAVGDACLFHTRQNRLLDAFPLERAEQFTSRPRLLRSRSPLDGYWERHAEHRAGRALPGDRLWLATDALAQWCLGECEADCPPWSDMELLCSEAEAGVHFAAFVAGLGDRPARRLRNDDVTLLMVHPL